jgi:hypothetical protein
MSTSNLKHLERIKENIDKSHDLNEEEKSNSMKHVNLLAHYSSSYPASRKWMRY